MDGYKLHSLPEDVCGYIHTHHQIHLVEQQITHENWFYLPHIASVKQGVLNVNIIYFEQFVVFTISHYSSTFPYLL